MVKAIVDESIVSTAHLLVSTRSIRGKLRRFGKRVLRLPPPLTLLIIYAVLVLIGAVFLLLPVARTGPLTFGEAIFTSASAVTVTGLVLYDTGSHFTVFGQAVIVILIQLGGLGLMSFAVLIMTTLGLPIGLPRSITLREDLGQNSLRDLGMLVRLIAIVFVVCEGLGVLFLMGTFVPVHGWASGFWHAVFHSVSAFNNAGFALYPDSLTRYALDPIINSVIPLLFIFGGIGFAVIADVARHKLRWRPLSLHSKLMLVGTIMLIGSGVSLFAVLEWSNPRTLGLYDDPVSKLTVAWFQGVTPRTAGFNTADFGATHDSTSLMTITLMLIGGGPTSTAGGIKVTTFICLLLAMVAFFRRSTELNAFGRSIPLEDVLRVTALVAVAILFVAAATFIISISHDGEFLDLVFEVASAFGTVGLSRGATGDLDGVGQAVIVLLMFAGRVGPLTLGFSLATRTRPRIRYPKSPVYFG